MNLLCRHIKWKCFLCQIYSTQRSFNYTPSIKCPSNKRSNRKSNRLFIKIITSSCSCTWYSFFKIPYNYRRLNSFIINIKFIVSYIPWKNLSCHIIWIFFIKIESFICCNWCFKERIYLTWHCMWIMPNKLICSI